ncbi:CoA ester lyase [Pusillimonas sp. MFBS29]|uniref:HpcH/HpaI aldolase/citrate lyase family protein n=1 Tax=Pusillimonas sp. MFBS29 TaxID=2886690 RepID=UPI001D105580|nr:CoA ester lyase [Pusillimonas sp. MFBS29]MCC2596377.1 CoA ester lyase [Pusillimonas sp. MFBS29]
MRSKLFVPGSRPDLFAKAFAGPADAISLDLEDSVSAEQKAQARQNIVGWLDRMDDDATLRNGKVVIVRINACDTIEHQDDLAACVRSGVDLINLPKPDSADQVREVSHEMSRLEARHALSQTTGLLLNIETPRALRLAADLAAADARVRGLQLGLADLFEPAGIARHERSALEQVLFQTRLAAAEAGVYAIDGAFANIKDTEGFRDEAALARRMGFIGKSCIHPSQIALANLAFMPTAEEIEFAQRVVDAANHARAQGQGVCVVDGKMIDAPFVQRAKAILDTARPTP